MVWNFRLLSESPGCLHANPIMFKQRVRLLKQLYARVLQGAEVEGRIGTSE